MMAAGMLDIRHSVRMEASDAAPMLPVRRAPVTGSTMTMVTGSLKRWRPSASQEEVEGEALCLLLSRHFMGMVEVGAETNHLIIVMHSACQEEVEGEDKGLNARFFVEVQVEVSKE